MIGNKWVKKGITGEALGKPVSPFPSWLTKIFGTGLGTGYAPVAQGTAGSLLFVILWWFFVPDEPFVQAAILLIVTWVSIPLSAWGERMWGEDPGRITVDEFAGQAVALFMVPHVWYYFVASFILFRIFDSFKLPFIRKNIETLPGGYGVTLDDTVAGLLARCCMVPILLIL